MAEDKNKKRAKTNGQSRRGDAPARSSNPQDWKNEPGNQS